MDKFNDSMRIRNELSEGAYLFKPEYEGPNNTQYHYPYSLLDKNIVYQRGENLEQYTLLYNNNISQAVVNIRFSPEFFEEIIEMDVELNAVDYEKDPGKSHGKDVTVNWRFYNGFDPKEKFWTDSNALTMINRTVNDHDGGFFGPAKISNISSNYFPVDSAIAIRDFNGSNVQVTVMNDRAQGGSADLSNKAQIELIQQRRTAFDDDKGVQEFLNETDSYGLGN